MSYGLTSTGFVPKTLPVIQDEIVAALRAEFGPSVAGDVVLLEIVGILAERYALLWELAEAVNASQDPDSATGPRLDALCALTGTLRKPAQRSTATLTLTGTPLTLVTTGSRAGTEDGDEFLTTEDVALVALDAWQAATAYEIGDRVTNADRAYVCTDDGTSAGSGGPTTTDDEIADNTVKWRYMGEGTAAADVLAAASETGPIVAFSGTITEIVTPVAGWQSVINLLDADVGSDEETDPVLRVRREVEISGQGSGTADAIRAGLLQVEGVTAVTVFVNNTNSTVDGMPPKSVEALVQGGDDQDIWDALLSGPGAVGAGIETHGTEVGTSVDSSGTAQTMKFSRPEEIDVYVDVTLTKDPDTYPVDGDDQVKAAIVAYGDAQKAGRDVVASAISAQCFKVAGVLDVSSVLIDDEISPATSTTITVTPRQIAVYDTSRISVSSSDGTP